MPLTKKHWLIAGGLLSICILIVGLVLFTNVKENTVEEQVDRATKERDKAENTQKEVVKEKVGEAIPSMEEVTRLLSQTDNQTLYEEIIHDEYGKDIGAYIFNAFVAKTLPSNADNALTKMVKQGLMQQAFQKDAYRAPINLVTQEFQSAPPFSSTSGGFKEVVNGLYAGYVSSEILSLEGAPQDVPTIRLAVTWISDTTKPVSELEKQLLNIPLEVNGLPSVPFYTKIREVFETLTTEEHRYNAGFTKDIHMIGLEGADFLKKSPKDVQIYEGTAFITYHYVELHQVDVRNIQELDVKIGEKVITIRTLPNLVSQPYEVDVVTD